MACIGNKLPVIQHLSTVVSLELGDYLTLSDKITQLILADLQPISHQYSAVGPLYRYLCLTETEDMRI